MLRSFFSFILHFFFFSSRRRHTRWTGDWSSDVCSSDLDGREELPYGSGDLVVSDLGRLGVLGLRQQGELGEKPQVHFLGGLPPGKERHQLSRLGWRLGSRQRLDVRGHSGPEGAHVERRDRKSVV